MEQQLMIRRWIRQSVICRLHSCQATTELTHWSFLYELWFWLARSTSLQSKKIVIHLVNKQHLPKRIYRWGPCFNWGCSKKKKKHVGQREQRTTWWTWHRGQITASGSQLVQDVRLDDLPFQGYHYTYFRRQFDSDVSRISPLESKFFQMSTW